MHVIRSTIAASDMFHKIREHYSGFSQSTACVFEYRGVNDIYRCTRNNRTCFFKIYARKDIDRPAIEAEVEITNHLKASGVPVAYPIARKNGEYLLPIDMPEGTRFGVLFTEAQGAPCNSDLVDEQQIIEISRLFSDMHESLDAMPTSPQRWKLDTGLFLDHSIAILEDYSQSNPQIELPFLKDVVKVLKEHIRDQSEFWNWGLCHGDAYTGNIHRSSEGKLTIYDFDFCGYGWRAYDVTPFVAGSFSAGVGEDVVTRRETRLEYFLRGYERGLSDAEIEALFKVFVPFRRIFNMGYLYEALTYVWGNRLRRELIVNDTRRLHDWMDTYW